MIIAGPTGVGKTDLAISLAKSINGEIIGADAMQVYRYMDIGTAKPTQKEQAQVQHHLVDVVDPDEPFTAADFRNRAARIIKTLVKEEKPVFVVGGTGLYIKALTEGLCAAENGNESVRKQLKAAADSQGSDALYRRLQTVDPISAEKIHTSDIYRIVRALEVFESTGRPLSAYHRDHRFLDRPYHTLKIGLSMDREALYRRINARVEQMIKEGLLEEVNQLLKRGYDASLKAMQSIGYRHVVGYLQGATSWEDMVRLFKRDTRRYAKRQMTWFRADKEMMWFEPSQVEAIRAQVKVFVTS